MNWDNLDWNNFSCVDMARSIRNEIDARLDSMTPAERKKYYAEINAKYCTQKQKREHRPRFC